jgi:hypothetical protein
LNGCISEAAGTAKERISTGGRVFAAGVEVFERFSTDGCVEVTSGVS